MQKDEKASRKKKDGEKCLLAAEVFNAQKFEWCLIFNEWKSTLTNVKKEKKHLRICVCALFFPFRTRLTAVRSKKRKKWEIKL